MKYQLLPALPGIVLVSLFAGLPSKVVFIQSVALSNFPTSEFDLLCEKHNNAILSAFNPIFSYISLCDNTINALFNV